MASKVKRRVRSRKSPFQVGDSVECRVGDDWHPGTVSRSLFRGSEVDVRLPSGSVMKGLLAHEVREVNKKED